jgi:hypothetical protein
MPIVNYVQCSITLTPVFVADRARYLQYGEAALKAIAKHIVRLPAERFDIRHWRSSCGTVGCAIGHGCNLEEVRRTGLYLDHGGSRATPRYGVREGYTAVGVALGICYADVLDLFAPFCYGKDPSAHEVAARIWEYVDAKRDED